MQAIESAVVLYDPKIAVAQAKAASDIVRTLRAEVLRQDIDFGVIPGTGNKPVLLKPGAERLCSAFGLSPEFELIGKVEEWDTGRFHYQYRCRLIHIETGKTVATGIGSCNSMESKYRWRWLWPNQLKDAGLSPDGMVKRTTKSKQIQYRVTNEDPFDQVNTIDKMAQKRALIAATLIGCNASEFFTQDLEDIKAFNTEDVIEGEVIDDQPPVKTEQHWYDDPEKRSTVLGFISKKFDLNEQEAEKLVGKKLREFASGQEAAKAIEAAATAPATPKNGNAPHWSETAEDISTLIVFLEGFELLPEEALQRLDVTDWKAFKIRTDAEEAIRALAIAECWPMIATRAGYSVVKSFQGKADRKFIKFNTPIPMMWWKGRQELVATIEQTATADWSLVLTWEPENTYDLPEEIRIIPVQDGDKLSIARIMSSSTVPF